MPTVLVTNSGPQWGAVIVLMTTVLIVVALRAYRDRSLTDLMRAICVFGLICAVVLFAGGHQAMGIALGTPVAIVMIVVSVKDYARRISLLSLLFASILSFATAVVFTYLTTRGPAIGLGILASIFWCAALLKMFYRQPSQ